MDAMTIASLARAADVGVETVRYYQRRGLIAVPERVEGARRYLQPDLHRLRFVRSAQAAGFSLAEIAELLALDSTEDRARAHEMANGRIAALNEKIADLQASRDALARLAERCGGGSAGPCPILEAFERG